MTFDDLVSLRIEAVLILVLVFIIIGVFIKTSSREPRNARRWDEFNAPAHILEWILAILVMAVPFSLMEWHFRSQPRLMLPIFAPALLFQRFFSRSVSLEPFLITFVMGQAAFYLLICALFGISQKRPWGILDMALRTSIIIGAPLNLIYAYCLGGSIADQYQYNQELGWIITLFLLFAFIVWLFLTQRPTFTKKVVFGIFGVSTFLTYSCFLLPVGH